MVQQYKRLDFYNSELAVLVFPEEICHYILEVIRDYISLGLNLPINWGQARINSSTLREA